MEVKSLLMVMATLTIAGCSQNEMTAVSYTHLTLPTN